MLDDGVLGNHEDLSDNFLLEKNYTDLDVEDMLHPQRHGTKCTGIISAVNNNKGLVGVAHGCKLASFIVLSYQYTRVGGHLDESEIVEYFSDELFEDAIHYACDSALASVFSFSWGFKGMLSETYMSAIDYATQYGRNGKGCILVFSSGNKLLLIQDPSETNVIRPTAVLPNVLSVGATMSGGHRAGPTAPLGEVNNSWESCFGDSLDLMAPGFDIPTTCYDSNDCYTSFEGTSAAAPHVAGVAALVLSIDSTLTYQEVFEILCSTATKVHQGEDDGYVYASNSAYLYGTWNNEMGYGMVNAHHAVLRTLYRDYYITGTSEIGLCETGNYHIHGTRPFNDSITCAWTSSPNIEILSTTDSVVARGTRPGPGWVAFNIIHDNDSLPLFFPVNVTNGGITVLTDHEFASNTTLSAPHFTDADLIIDSLATLTITDTLYVAGGSRIIVRPGGKLIVNGGTLTNACDGEMWQGIIVEGNANLRQAALAQGSVILNNATIENARDAICTMGSNPDSVFEHTGGIIQATNTLFRNNRRSVAFLSYENHTTGGAVTDNASYFTRCIFTIDNNNLFAQNGTSFNSHVTMWHVRGVKFNGCTFRNETSNHSGKAVYTEEAGFIAKRVCPSASGTQDPCYCAGTATDTVTRCSFTGFDTAVHVAGTNGSFAVTLDNCDFSDNHVGIFLAAADNAQVSFCDFDLDYMSSASTGVYLKNSTGYTVESNSFHRTHYSALNSVGVCTDNSGTAENVIRLNDFAKLTYGCYAWNCNAVTGIKLRGLQYVCNSYDSCKYSIYVRTAAKIRTAQGSHSVGADNSFYNNIGIGRSITIPSDHTNVSYYYHNSGSHTPVGSSNYTLRQATNANSCASSLCGIQRFQGDGLTALEQYLSMAEEYVAIVETLRGVETCHGASLQTDAPDQQDETDDADLIARLSDLSAAMGDLARTEIRNILNDSVPDMALLKRWYATIMETQNFASPQMADSTIPVAAYQLAEVYSMEGDLAAAAALLSSLPQQFITNEAARNEYANYMALQQLRETVAGNWYTMTDSDIAAMQQVAEYDNGRAARMAKEILCFFHHICYEDEPLWDWDGIGERALRGDGACPIAATDDGLRLHPNPTTHTLTVESASPIRTLTVYDLAGRVMMTVDGGANDYSPLRIMDVSSLPNGIYLLRAVTDSGVETGRFVKN
ncbi:MAG: S8 family serine peptidase [Bacteroidales bacterium]|nr:S8 family serine peptidase [Bacteroidales bacterium]